MAPSSKHLSFIFLTFLISSSLIQARESKFFSKFTRDENTATIPTTTTNNYATTPTTTTTTTPTNGKETELPKEHAPLGKQDEEPSFIPQTGNGYGLYSRDKNQYSPTTTTNNAYDMYANLPGKTSTQEYSGGSYKNKEFNMDSNHNNYNYNNNYKYNNNWSKGEKQGMSDTRFLENGKYYHPLNNEDSYRNVYQPMSGSNKGFGTSKGVDSRNNYNYGNNDNAYEFNNSKEDPQYQQEGETQDGYIP